MLTGGGFCGACFLDAGIEGCEFALRRGLAEKAEHLALLGMQLLGGRADALAAVGAPLLGFRLVLAGILEFVAQGSLAAGGIFEGGAGIGPVAVEGREAQAEIVGALLPVGKPARERHHIAEVGIERGAGAVGEEDGRLKVVGSSGGDFQFRAAAVDLLAAVGHLRLERGYLLVEAVDVALVEVVGLQVFLGFFEFASRAFCQEAYGGEACLVVHGLRGIGKGLVDGGVGMPFFQVGLEAFLPFLEKSLLGLQAHLFREKPSAQFFHLPALGGQRGGEGVVFLLEAGKQVAQFALRLGVVRVMGRAAHGTGRALYELLAEPLDVFCLAKGVGGADAVVGTLFGSQFLGGGGEFSLLVAYGCGNAAHERVLLFYFGISVGDVPPQFFSALQSSELVFQFYGALLHFRAVVPVVALPVNEEFAFQGVHLGLAFLQVAFAGCEAAFEHLLAAGEGSVLGVLLAVAGGFGLEHGEFVFHQVELIEHNAVHGEFLNVALPQVLLLLRGFEGLFLCLALLPLFIGKGLAIFHLLPEVGKLRLSHFYFAGKGIAPADERLADAEELLRIVGSLAGGVETAGGSIGRLFGGGEGAGCFSLALLHGGEVGLPHPDFLKKWLYGRELVVAQEFQFIAAQRLQFLVGAVVLLLLLRHLLLCKRRVGIPLQLPRGLFQAFLVLTDRGLQEVLALFEGSKFFGFEAVVEHALHLVFQSLHIGLRLGVEFVNLLRNTAVDVGAREFFEQGRLIVAAGF